MSINLTNPEQYSAGTAVIEANAVAAAIDPVIDFGSQSIAWIMQAGQFNGNVFIPGSRARGVTVQINITAGIWSAAGQNGTIPTPLQTQLHNLLINMRNAMENFAINNGLIQGSQTLWV